MVGSGDSFGECDLVYGGAPEQAGSSNVAILRNRLLSALNKARAVRRAWPEAFASRETGGGASVWWRARERGGRGPYV